MKLPKITWEPSAWHWFANGLVAMIIAYIPLIALSIYLWYSNRKEK